MGRVQFHIPVTHVQLSFTSPFAFNTLKAGNFHWFSVVTNKRRTIVAKLAHNALKNNRPSTLKLLIWAVSSIYGQVKGQWPLMPTTNCCGIEINFKQLRLSPNWTQPSASGQQTLRELQAGLTDHTFKYHLSISSLSLTYISHNWYNFQPFSLGPNPDHPHGFWVLNKQDKTKGYIFRGIWLRCWWTGVVVPQTRGSTLLFFPPVLPSCWGCCSGKSVSRPEGIKSDHFQFFCCHCTIIQSSQRSYPPLMEWWGIILPVIGLVFLYLGGGNPNQHHQEHQGAIDCHVTKPLAMTKSHAAGHTTSLKRCEQ